MSIPLIEKDVCAKIFNFVDYSLNEATPEAVKRKGKAVENISLVNKMFKSICEEKIKILSKIFYLLNKYHKYNDMFKEYHENPQLLDALSTGWERSGKPTFSVYNQVIGEDIKEIVKLIPESINCVTRFLHQRRSGVHPLAVACFNENIPVDIIELLLKNGANPNATYHSGGDQISLLADPAIQATTNPRITYIKQLLTSYGGQALRFIKGNKIFE